MAIGGDPPWGLTLERVPPGCQTSNAHAHSVEDEFCLILGGKARYWHQGQTPERILVAGDAVGWKAGTGICHTLLNDAEDEDGAGQFDCNLLYFSVADSEVCQERTWCFLFGEETEKRTSYTMRPLVHSGGRIKSVGGTVQFFQSGELLAYRVIRDQMIDPILLEIYGLHHESPLL